MSYNTPVIPSLNGEDTFYKVTSSSEFSNDYTAWRCCNYEVANQWATKNETSNYWLMYEHPFEICVG